MSLSIRIELKRGTRLSGLVKKQLKKELGRDFTIKTKFNIRESTTSYWRFPESERTDIKCMAQINRICNTIIQQAQVLKLEARCFWHFEGVPMGYYRVADVDYMDITTMIFIKHQ